MAKDTIVTNAGKETRQRAGWLTTSAAAKPVPFELEDGKLVCMDCSTSHADRDAFIKHICAGTVKAAKAGG